MLTRFNGIALATKELVRTDIPRPMLEHLVPLALKVKNAKVTSVQFVPPLINTGYPDWAKIRTVTAKALKDSVTPKPVVASAAPSPSASPPASAKATPKPKPSDVAAPKGLTDGCGTL
ncbi:LCP family protein [Nonomuraea recticatena]|uniref:hypothetical protein n=1 Tax=Nonomuraea recticatena TaxID=46178 RepID=UPI00361BF9E6